MDWRASAAILEREFPEEYGDPAMAGRHGAGSALAGSSGAPEGRRPNPDLVEVLLQDNEELRAQLRALIPES
jgi:hypothetical protein